MSVGEVDYALLFSQEQGQKEEQTGGPELMFKPEVLDSNKHEGIRSLEGAILTMAEVNLKAGRSYFYTFNRHLYKPKQITLTNSCLES